MSNFNKLCFLFYTIFLINFFHPCKSQSSEYEKILSEVKHDKVRTKKKAENSSNPIFPSQIGKWWCDPSFKLNSVREDIMTNHNFNSIMYRYKYFLLYVTASWCDYCCQEEKELLGVKQMLREKTVEGEEIQIVQIHSDIDLEALKDLKIGFFKVPSLYFVHNKEFIQYNSFWKADNIMRFINNLINPVVELHTIGDVERFFDTSRNFDEKNDFLGNTKLNFPEQTDHHLRNRLIGFFSDIEDYSAEYSLFLSLADKISHRPDLRIGIVTDKEIVKHFKQTYDGIWFNSHSWNSIVLKRIDKYYFLDLSLLNDKLEIFMVYNTISFVDELSNNNNFITSKIATPIALFFIDTTFIIPNFHAHLKFLIDISKTYVGKYVFMFIDGNAKTKSKEELGFKKEAKIPTLVINYVQSKKQKIFPYNLPYNDQEIIKFLDQNYLSKFTGSDLDELREKQIKSYDDKIVRNLKFATKIEKKNFEKIVSNKKYDVVVFVIDTDYDETSLNRSKYINKISQRFKSFGIKSVLISYYDINENGPLIYQGKSLEKGEIFIYQSNSKDRLKFNENISLLRLMKWIEKNCENKIRLPSLPHVDLNMQEEYYKRKAILESYEENYSKSELEIDDMIDIDFESNSGDSLNAKTDL